MVILSAFALVASSLLQRSRAMKFPQVPTDTQQPPTGANQRNGFSGSKATA